MPLCTASDEMVSPYNAFDEWYHHAINGMIRYHHALRLLVSIHIMQCLWGHDSSCNVFECVSESVSKGVI